MKARRASLAIAICAALVALSGCAASPEPAEPTPLFASEEEAFAAAEATYRAYVDALNEVDLSDPSTFEPVFALTTGDANAGARRSFTQMHADGLTVGGDSVVTVVVPLNAELGAGSIVSIVVCLDVSAITLVDASGESAVEESRPDVQSMHVSLTPVASSETKLLISSLDGYERELCE